jgi:hypothetical protein
LLGIDADLPIRQNNKEEKAKGKIFHKKLTFVKKSLGTF